MSGTATVMGLDEADRLVLSDWLDRAGGRGIDAAIDFSLRPWNIEGAGVVIGVFQSGRDMASWLVLRCGGQWFMVCCADGVVSPGMASLETLLKQI